MNSNFPSATMIANDFKDVPHITPSVLAHATASFEQAQKTEYPKFSGKIEMHNGIPFALTPAGIVRIATAQLVTLGDKKEHVDHMLPLFAGDQNVQYQYQTKHRENAAIRPILGESETETVQGLQIKGQSVSFQDAVNLMDPAGLQKSGQLQTTREKCAAPTAERLMQFKRSKELGDLKMRAFLAYPDTQLMTVNGELALQTPKGVTKQSAVQKLVPSQVQDTRNVGQDI